jgi:hypothetical protein
VTWYIGGDYDAWKTTPDEPEPDPYDLACAAEEAALERGDRD